MSIKQILIVIAIVLFAVAAWWPGTPRVNLMSLGLVFFAASFLVP